MTIDYKFAIGDKVKIIDLDLKGIVISLWTGRRGNEVQVRYSTNGKYEEYYFFENELEEIIINLNQSIGYTGN